MTSTFGTLFDQGDFIGSGYGATSVTELPDKTPIIFQQDFAKGQSFFDAYVTAVQQASGQVPSNGQIETSIYNQVKSQWEAKGATVHGGQVSVGDSFFDRNQPVHIRLDFQFNSPQLQIGALVILILIVLALAAAAALAYVIYKGVAGAAGALGSPWVAIPLIILGVLLLGLFLFGWIGSALRQAGLAADMRIRHGSAQLQFPQLPLGPGGGFGGPFGAPFGPVGDEGQVREQAVVARQMLRRQVEDAEDALKAWEREQRARAKTLPRDQREVFLSRVKRFATNTRENIRKNSKHESERIQNEEEKTIARLTSQRERREREERRGPPGPTAPTPSAPPGPRISAPGIQPPQLPFPQFPGPQFPALPGQQFPALPPGGFTSPIVTPSSAFGPTIRGPTGVPVPTIPGTGGQIPIGFGAGDIRKHKGRFQVQVSKVEKAVIVGPNEILPIQGRVPTSVTVSSEDDTLVSKVTPKELTEAQLDTIVEAHRLLQEADYDPGVSVFLNADIRVTKAPIDPKDIVAFGITVKDKEGIPIIFMDFNTASRIGNPLFTAMHEMVHALQINRKMKFKDVLAKEAHANSIVEKAEPSLASTAREHQESVKAIQCPTCSGLLVEVI